jgi:hypothetical protein
MKILFKLILVILVMTIITGSWNLFFPSVFGVLILYVFFRLIFNR